jgi:hypothetical protein
MDMISFFGAAELGQARGGGLSQTWAAKRNFASIVALACSFILVNSVHTA